MSISYNYKSWMFYYIIINFFCLTRRKAFWVVKQVLQLGMSDAFDDWLVAKIQLLRRGSIVASGIKRLEQVIVMNL